MANIKKITIDGVSYDVYDEYCRRRLAGAGTVYSISYAVTYSSSNTYTDIISGSTVTLSTATVTNSTFNSSADDINVDSTKYLITLTNVGSSTTNFYVIKVGDLTVGDTVFVKEKNVADRWMSAKATNCTFSKLEEKIDLSSYALKSVAGKAGTYTSTGSNVATSSAGGETITSSSAGEQTATGSASVTYKKSDTATGSAGAGSAATTGGTSGGTVDFTKASFAGTTATITISGSVSGTDVDDHSYTPAGTIGGSQAVAGHTHSATLTTASVSYIKTVASATGSDGAHTHDVASHSHGTDVAAVTGLPNFYGGSASGTFMTTLKTAGSASLTGTTTFVTAAIKSASLGGTTTFKTEGHKASYDSNNEALVLTSGSTGTVSISTAAASTASVGITHSDPVYNTGNVSWSAASLGTLSTTNVAAAPAAATLTAASAGSHTHSISSTAGTFNNVTAVSIGSGGAVTISGANFTFAGTTATLAHTVTQGTFSGSTSYKPAGSISGSQALTAHTHSYTAPSAHTHTIGLTDTTATGSASVAISAHTHSITTSNHTHTLNNHTHSVTIPNCAS